MRKQTLQKNPRFPGNLQIHKLLPAPRSIPVQHRFAYPFVARTARGQVHASREDGTQRHRSPRGTSRPRP